jgi:hypothetical protein
MLDNPQENPLMLDCATRKKFLGCIFAEKIVLENGFPSLPTSPPGEWIHWSMKSLEDKRRV